MRIFEVSKNICCDQKQTTIITSVPQSLESRSMADRTTTPDNKTETPITIRVIELEMNNPIMFGNKVNH